MRTSIRLDAYNTITEEWTTVFHAYSHQSPTKIFLTDAEGVKESPTFTRNSAQPLFGDGIIESKISYATARYINITILANFDTVADANSFIETITNLPNSQRSQYMKLFRVEWNSNGSAKENYRIDVRCADEFIEDFEQKGRNVEMTLSFVAPNPNFTKQTGPIV